MAGGSIANLLCNLRRRQENSDTPLIDWDTVILFQPAMVVGAVIGGYLNAVSLKASPPKSVRAQAFNGVGRHYIAPMGTRENALK